MKFYEKGDRPLEIVASRQWYIRNGGRDELLRERLVARAAEITWHPAYMRSRYENWVEGLNGDWLISRQRFFGVPFPVWYRLDAAGEPDYEQPLVAAEDTLPVDPSSDCPPGFTEDQRGVAGGFMGDPDVMDTWATSSLTPQIVGGWERDPTCSRASSRWTCGRRRTTSSAPGCSRSVVRADAEFDTVPWRHAAISGWILDPDRKKMGKSNGNALTPIGLLEEHGSDAVRYWAASGRPGTDTTFDPGQMKIGRRLAIKILNASRFVLGFGAADAEPDPAAITEPLDRALLAELADVVRRATTAFDAYEYTRALEAVETFFWSFCDDYVELVKDRAYGGQGEPAALSAKATLAVALSVLLRLFAPILPFVAEEVWSWWQEGSVHRASWPTAAAVAAVAADGERQLLVDVATALSAIRKAKSEAKVSMRTDVERAVLAGPADAVDRIMAAATDLSAAGRIAKLVATPGGEQIVVDVDLA